MCSLSAGKMTHFSQVVFFGIRGTTSLADIAIDHLSIVPGECAGIVTFADMTSVNYYLVDEVYSD